MPIIESHIDPESEEFRANARAMEGLLEDLRTRLARHRAGGGDEAQKRQRSLGKLPVSDRIEKLLDRDTPCLEIGALAGHGLYDGAAPCAGMVTGIGRVRWPEVMVVSIDPTVRGGTYFPLTVTKHM